MEALEFFEISSETFNRFFLKFEEVKSIFVLTFFTEKIITRVFRKQTTSLIR